MRGSKCGSLAISVAPTAWGPAAWHVLHRMSFQLDGEDAARFFGSVQAILPCAKCRTNMLEHLQHLPIPQYQDEDQHHDDIAIAKWVWQLHARVSQSIAKPSHNYKRPTFASVKKRYQKNNTMEDEAPFLRALLKTHPGSRVAAKHPDYLTSLQTFMHFYLSLSISISPHNQHQHQDQDHATTWLQSKTEFKQLLAKLCTPTKHITLPECT